ncbi:MAG: Ig-like domain-containing protein [Steroidobacteraceae bacterium]
MARMVQLLVRDPSGAVWKVDAATSESVRTEANHVYQFAVNGKAAAFPSGTTIQRSGHDLKIRFADGEELLLTDWYATPGASLAMRGARLLDADGAVLPAVSQLESSAEGAAAAEVSSPSPESGDADGAEQVAGLLPEPLPAPSGVTEAAPTASTTASAAASDATTTALPSPPPPTPPATAAASGGFSGTGILAGLGGVALLGAAAGGGGGGSSGNVTPAPPPISAIPSELALAAGSDSGVSGDRITNDNTPTIRGRADANASITVRDAAGTTIATATADATGNWSATPGTALPDGVHTLQVIANRGGGAGDSTAASFTVTVDTVAPAAPTVRLDPAADSGTAGDGRTNDATPTISGTGNAGDTVRVTLPGEVVLTTTVAADGSWSVTPTAALADGSHSLSVTATDVAGNVSVASVLAVAVDTTAPNAPTVRLDPASDSGAVGDGRTNDTTPTISGTGSAGDTIRVDFPGGVVLTTTVAANGSWSVTPTAPLANGMHSLSVTATDAAGNVSVAAPLSLTIVTTGPSAPTARLAASSDSGVVGDGLTNDTTPTISGTGTSGDTIRVSLPGGVVLTTTVAANGNWSVTPTTPLANGSHALSVTATDPVGNVSAATPLTVNIDTVAPAAPTLHLDPASDSGVTGDNRTNDTTPTISGTGTAGDAIRLSLPGGMVLTTTVAANGSWSETLTSPLANGTHTLSATAVDAAGNTSSAAVLALTIDSAAPTAPTLTIAEAADGYVNQTEASSGGGVPMTVALPTGTAAGDVVTLLVDGPGAADTTLSHTVTAANVTAGSASVLIPTAALAANGGYSVTARVTDRAGNDGATSPASVFTVDRTAPAAPTLTIPEAADGYVNQAEAGSNGGVPVTVALPAGLVAGDVVTLLVDGPGAADTTLTHPLTAANLTAGNVSVLIPTAALATNGGYSVTARITDLAGNAGSVSPANTFTVDRTAPAAPTVSIVEASDGYVNQVEATSGGGVPVTVALPAGTIAGDVVTLLVDGPGAADTTLNHTVTAANVTAGSASVLIPTAALAAEGAYSVTVRLTDLAGNVGAVSTATTFTVDRTAPATPSAPDLAAASDTGTSSTDNLTSVTAPTFNGSGAAVGATVQLVDTNGVTVIGTGVATAGGNWTITTGTLAAGTHSITARQLDAAGNASNLSTPLNVTIDTAGPSFGSPAAVNEGFASVVLSSTSLSATDNVSAPAALAVTAASFVSGTGFVAADFSIGIAGGQATVTRTAGALDKHGSAVFSVSMRDAAGNVTTQNVTLAVTEVNDAPAGTNGTLTTEMNTALVIGPEAFGFTDPHDTPPDALASVIVSSLPAQGQLTLGGQPVTAGQEIAVAQLNAGNLQFTPGLNQTGAGYASFTFQVRDNGGTANGGVNLDPTPNTLTINVTLAAPPVDAGGDLSLSMLFAAPADSYLLLGVDATGNLSLDLAGSADGADQAAQFALAGSAVGPGTDLDLLAPLTLLPGDGSSGMG